MKKTISLLLVMCLCLALVPFAVTAQDSAPVSVGLELRLSPDGKSVSATVRATENAGIFGLIAYLVYDPAVFTMTKSQRNTTLFPNGSQNDNPDIAGMAHGFSDTEKTRYAGKSALATVLVSPDKVTEESFVIATVTFAMKDGVPDSNLADAITLRVVEVSYEQQGNTFLYWGDQTEPWLFMEQAYSVPLLRIPVPSPESDFEYVLNGEGTCTLTKYIGSDTDVVIPSTLGGLQVTKIGTYYDEDDALDRGAFYNLSGLCSVEIPSTVQEIADKAFFKCTSCTVYVVNSPFCAIGENALGMNTGKAPVSGVTVYGFANAQTYVSGLAGNTAGAVQYAALYTPVSADFLQKALDGNGFRTIGTVRVLEGLAKVGMIVQTGENAAKGESSTVHTVMLSADGTRLEAGSIGATYPWFYAAGVRSKSGSFTSGTVFTITPYAIGTDGTVYYGASRTYIYLTDGE